jgi:hypothetical protein
MKNAPAIAGRGKSSRAFSPSLEDGPSLHFWPGPQSASSASCLGEWQEALSLPHPSAEHPLVAQDPVRDLFISAKDLFVEANGVLISETPLRSLPLAVTHEAVALYEMQMLLSGLTPAIFISLGSESASRCNLSGIFWFLGLSMCERDTERDYCKSPKRAHHHSRLTFV